jgi:hypothetical protein
MVTASLYIGSAAVNRMVQAERAVGMNRKETNSMNACSFARMNVTPLLTLGELGLERRATVEEAGSGLARIAEAQVVRWVQFPAGALFFTLLTGDPESGALYILDRKTGVFYWLNFDDRKWGGYSLAEYHALVRTHRLTTLARRPRLLEQRCRPPVVA